MTLQSGINKGEALVSLDMSFVAAFFVLILLLG